MAFHSQEGQRERWIFTYHNYEENVNYGQYLRSSEFMIQRAIWGYEVGDRGTRHLQGYVELKRSLRLSHVRKIFRNAFWQGAKGNARANYKYCSKGGKFETIGDFSKEISELGENAPTRPLSISLVVKGLLNPVTETQIKYRKSTQSDILFFDKIASMLQRLQEKHRLFSEWNTKLLYPWQDQCLVHVMRQGPREVLWVVGKEGNDGKSFLANVLHILYGFFMSDGSISTRDLCQLVKGRTHGFCFDISRADIEHFDYSTLEAVKNGFIISGKYKGSIRRFPNVPAVVFANNFPANNLLSNDRWKVVVLGAGEFSDMSRIAVVSPSRHFPFVHPPPLPDMTENFNFRQYLAEHLSSDAEPNQTTLNASPQNRIHTSQPSGPSTRFPTENCAVDRESHQTTLLPRAAKRAHTLQQPCPSNGSLTILDASQDLNTSLHEARFARPINCPHYDTGKKKLN